MAALLSIVVPAFNEERTLARTVRQALALEMPLELVVVDDGSTDATARIAEDLAREDPRVRVIAHPANRGKTAALRTGFAATTGDIVIVQDADLEYDPSEIPHVIQPILEGRAAVVYGSRFLVRRAARVLYFTHYVGNRVLTLLSNAFTNLNMTDVETGYKAFRGEIIREMVILSSGFGFEIEVTAKVAKLGCPIYEVPISYHGRTYAEGKKIGFRDGVQAIFAIFRYNLFCPLRASFRAVPSWGDDAAPGPGRAG